MRRTSWDPKLAQNVQFFFFFFPSDRAPQILELEGNLEWNLNSTPKIFCSATGNPLPSHNSIELRKLDSTVLKVENADKIYTAGFLLGSINGLDKGLDKMIILLESCFNVTVC